MADAGTQGQGCQGCPEWKGMGYACTCGITRGRKIVSGLIPRYSVGSKRPKGYPVLKTTERQTTVRVYRTQHVAQDVADKLNQWAGQEV